MRIVCGLDVHKDSVFVCILSENGDKFEAKYGVLTPELEALNQLLLNHFNFTLNSSIIKTGG